MSINNLSNDCGGVGSFNNRPSFLRDESAPTLIQTVQRYDNSSNDGDNAGGDGAKLFDGGAGKVDYRSIARAMMARLDALREKCFGGSSGSGDGSSTQESGDSDGDADSGGDISTSVALQQARAGGSKPSHWAYHGHWYSTGNAPSGSGSTTTTPPAGGGTTTTPPGGSTNTNTNSSTGTSTNTSTNTNTNSTTGSNGTSGTTTNNTTTPPSSGPISPTNSVSLNSGSTTIADTTITGTTGIVGDNATHIDTLNVSNVTIRSTNYGIYLGDCDSLNLSNVNITCDPNGGDSYSVRGDIQHFVSSDSTFNSGIKAFRIYGLEGGSSTRDTFTGDRVMLGGGYSNEWGDAGPFHNFTFTDSKINVNSVEMYDDTNNVVFDGVDFSGTGHISIQDGAHDIIFRNCTNLPQIRLYDANGNWSSPPANDRNIVITN